MYTCCLWDVYNLAPQQSHRRLFLFEQFSRKDVHTGNVSGYAPGYAVLTKTPEGDVFGAIRSKHYRPPSRSWSGSAARQSLLGSTRIRIRSTRSR